VLGQDGSIQHRDGERWPNDGRNIRTVWEMEHVGRAAWSKHTLDDAYFSSIETQEQAYWLGFIYADGHVGPRHVDLQLSDKDHEHILRFRDVLGSSYEPKDTQNGRTRVVLSSKRMADDLRALGIKTQMRIPDMSPDLVRHFVRGLFDGDGSAWKYMPAGRTKWRYMAEFLGTERMVREIADLLGLRARPKLGRGIHRVMGSSVADLAALYEYLYDGATVYLERKRVEFPQAQHVSSDVWPIPTQPYPEAHFATFPEELARRCILPGTPERVCITCGKPSERLIDVEYSGHVGHPMKDEENAHRRAQGVAMVNADVRARRSGTTTRWTDCGHDTWRPGVVLDPFMGSGTTALVARKLGRHSIGIELSPEYCELAANKRLAQQSLFA
jgi:hypothetical protein